MIDILDDTELRAEIKSAVNSGKKILYRRGLDYRFADKNGISIKGSLRNKEITPEELLKQSENYYIEIETDECNDSQVVFHGYSNSDME